MTILVTGGAGFIGTNFVLDWLARRRETVLNLDKLTYAGNRRNLVALYDDDRHVFVEGGIQDFDRVSDLLEEYRPRAVVNLAAESHVDHSIRDPEPFVQTNVVGTYRLLEAVRCHWATLPAEQQHGFRLVHVSTDEVFGSLGSAEEPFTEGRRFEPNSPYAATKASGDHMARAWNRTFGLPVITVNCSNSYGPYQYPEKLIPLMLSNALKGEELPVYGDGLHVRDWIYVGDHCRALQSVLDAGRPGETYNVGSGVERSNLDVVREICRLLDELHPREDGGSYRKQITFVADRPGHDRRYAVDSSKIACELGWRPREQFEDGLRKTVQWYLDFLAR